MTDQPKKYFVRFSNANDFDKISDFYDLNSHKNVLKRQTELMEKLTEDGAVIIIEDEKGTIVASSITYAHKTTDKDGVEHVNWQEIGTTRSVLNGFPGVFDAMIAMQTLRAFLVEPPEKTFAAQMETLPVQTLAGKLGWRRLQGDPPEKLLEGKAKTVADGHATDNDWFILGLEGLPTMAKWMEKTMDNPVLENKKTGEKIELDFSKSTFFKMFSYEIRNLAKRDFGDINTPDPQQNVKSSRDKWLKNFFR
ncbi:MAG: hypothetical protein PW788_08900 [Micavibrio sp.]|nr:hypothetical protein [Micavibrio sp.]